MTEVWLRLRKVGDTYTGWGSTDGQTFTQIGTRALAITRPTRIALYSNNNAATAPMVSTFTDLAVEQLIPDTAGGLAGLDIAASAFLLPDARTCVDIEALPAPAGTEVAREYVIAPGDLNTAGATITRSGRLTATSGGVVRVTATARSVTSGVRVTRSKVIEIIKLIAPAAGLAAWAGDGSALLSWDLAAVDTADIDTYTIEYKGGAQATWTAVYPAQIVRTSPNATSAQIAGLANGITYALRVIAHAGTQEAAASDPVTVRPAAPGLVGASVRVTADPPLVTAGQAVTLSAWILDVEDAVIGPLTDEVTYTSSRPGDGAITGGSFAPTTAGSLTVTAAVPGLAPGAVDVTVTPAALDRVDLDANPSPRIAVGEPVQLTAQGFDAYGNDLGFPSGSLVFASTGAGDEITGSGTSFTVTAGSIGPRIISATLDGQPLAGTLALTAYSDAPSVVTPPELSSDNPTVGVPISVSTGAWDPADATLTYAWLVDGHVVPDATGPTFTPRPQDRGKALAARVTAAGSGHSGSAQATVSAAATVAPRADVGALEAEAASVADAIVHGAYPAGDYTKASHDRLLDALEATETLLSNPDPGAPAVADAATELTAALTGLVRRGNVATMEAAVAASGALVQAEYTASSWAELSEAVDRAQGLIDRPENVTVGDVSAALNAVNAAISHLVAAVNISGLVTVVDGVRAQITAGILVQADYTVPSWDELDAAMTAADALIAAPGEVQSVVAAATSRVLDAAANLVAVPPAILVTELSNLIALADALALVASDYTPATWASLTAALGAARSQVAAATSQVAVDEARTAWAAALEGLVAAPDLGAPDQLATLIASVNALGLVADEYTAASWAALQAALAQAADAGAPAEAAAALTEVQAALGALVPRISRTQVASAVEAATRIGTAGYTPASAAALASAVAAARALLAQDHDTVTQADVDTALARVSEAIAALVVAPSDARPSDPVTVESIAGLRAALATLARDVAGLKAGGYTAESWLPVAAALAAAGTTATNPSAARADLEAAVAALSRAVVGLKAVVPTVDDRQTQVPPVATIARVKAAQKRVTLTVGTSITIPVRAWTDGGTVAAVAWKSSKLSVAKVSATGKIAAKKKGKATITASVGGKSVTIAVTVLARAAAKTKVTKAAATGVPRTMTVGQVAWITGTYAPAKATGVAVKFATSSSARVAVDKTGRLVAKAPGKATITVKAGTKSTRYTVTVTAG
ncbi:MAG: FIVAR domain-containing protein [Bifidobacteriaceae bacterium]|nr:FIVAR domain-containing protein [Bifidobacteriaceae bacterium]